MYPGYLSADIQGLLANNKEEANSASFIEPERSEIFRNSSTGHPLSHALCLKYRETFLYDGSLFMSTPVEGPLIVFGYKHYHTDPTVSVDQVPGDLRHIASFFNTYIDGRPSELEPPYSLFSNLSMREMNNRDNERDVVAGVRINCVTV
ncbi:hypothetical protein K458DRAFT_391426 [Lentithecium fluviatile CBS 122367]|uniref:Uncharacterized protein n=1 Tax=Lentithecium fluviatile CBS 122367 TaxID=1168545 RepID=A0A6G1IUJ4_9PLEO|nr:hypothetical protein K458DRAFT_391426 [Lentithecium fluviatile CBS 122367]